jgi:Asp-tRNA(Asn)/Glu-tRNA(Gln) amidotransferase A subunit family amidase
MRRRIAWCRIDGMPVTAIDLTALTAAQAAVIIARGEVSAEDYTRACLARIEAIEPEIQAFAHLDPAHALAQARARDEQRLSGQPLGPLHGVPVAIKDIIDTQDYPTECGSPLLSGRRPTTDATVVTKLREAGAVIIGKTVTTEFAFFNPGKTRNPHDTGRTPGGSSSGSAAAVAAGMVPVAIGTQTNGSIIRPGAFCGVYAMKASHGLISRAGILPLSRALDFCGPFARSLEDIALMLSVLAGYDPEDPDTRAVALPDFRRFIADDWPLEPRFAFVRTPVWDKADAATRAAFEKLAADLGENCIAIDLPDGFIDAWTAHRTIMAADMAHHLGGYIDRGGEVISEVLRALVAEGRAVTAIGYLSALDKQRAYREAFDGIFSHCNAIITPSTRGVAPIGLGSTGDPAFCSLWTLTGFPSINLPLLEGEDAMPLGVQVVGPMNDDARLLRSASWLVRKLGK